MTLSRQKGLIALLFALSGASGLIYEISWSKYLSLFIGSAPSSQMIVLAAFMGGLALGSFRWGRIADRHPRPLRLYGLLEVAIGLYCLLYPFLMALCERLFVAAGTAFALAAHPAALAVLKLLISAATLVVPAFCMGGTLPVLLRAAARDLSSSGRETARLYWVNSAGAMAGAALAGFYLIRVIGLDGAMGAAAAVNIAVGATAYFLPRPSSADAPEAPVRPASRPGTGAVHSPSAIRIAVVVAAASGFLSMVYELGWSRLLATLLGSSTYSFSLMLMAFIAGIALGSAMAARLMARTAGLLRLLAWCQLGTALFMAATLPLYDRLPYFIWEFSSAIPNTPSNFPLFLGAEFLFAFLLMIVPTTLSGMSLPVAARIASSDPHALGASVGGVFAVNTASAVAGALLTGLALIPWLGVRGAVVAAAACNAVLGVAVIASEPRPGAVRKLSVALAAAAAAVLYAVFAPPMNVAIASVGVFRSLAQKPPATYDEFVRGAEERTTLWYREGTTANVAVTGRRNAAGRDERTLVINGKADASTEGDLTTQLLLAQIPLTLVPDTGDVLVIGLGSGITAGSALRHPLRSLDCVEISPEVAACNGLFAAANGKPLDDPRTTLYLEDAITFAKISPKRYSCIISEPSNPWIAGIGNLFTTEFFALMRGRLAPGGVLAQWFHLYDVDDDVFRLVLRTIRSEFPYVSVWMPSDADVIFTASMSPLPAAFQRMERCVEGQRDDLARIRMNGLAALLSTEIAAAIPDSVAPRGVGPLNSERRPLLEFLAPVSFYAHADVGLAKNLDRRLGPPDPSLLLTQYAGPGGLSGSQHLDIARFQAGIAGDDIRMTVRSALDALGLLPEHPEALAILAAVAQQVRDTTDRLALLGRLTRALPQNPEVLATYAVEWTEWKRRTDPAAGGAALEEPLRLMRQAVSLSGGGTERYLLGLANICAAAGRHAEAGRAFDDAFALRASGRSADSAYTTGQVALLAVQEYLDARDTAMAADCYERLKAIDPNNPALAEFTDSLTTEEPR